MTPADARNLAIDYGRKAEMHLAVDDFAAARSCLGLAKEYAIIGLRLEQESPSSSPTSSLDETKQAGAIPPRLRPAPIHPNTERLA